MRPLLLLLVSLASVDAFAQSGASLGTLFQTPQERVAIDRTRAGETGTAATSFGALRANPVITGYVKRSDGKHTVFVDNEPFDVKGEKADRLLQPRNVQSYVPPPPEPPATAPESDAAPKGLVTPPSSPVPRPTPAR